KRTLKTFDYQAASFQPITLEKGAEMGRFKLGSTAIVLFGPEQIKWSTELNEGTAVEMGQLLATSLKNS
ncbi:phosphatidylserine decarboxylase, partial [Acinetobacter towneri]